ncbi:MAG: hybrid sensor histidine kinase/response regulator [Candidatus Hydrogenedentes bacterium]|nr:hybrid sensor histidine kinase/response regulator [Candidatus Hydrogenedentota bacterium]
MQGARIVSPNFTSDDAYLKTSVQVPEDTHEYSARILVVDDENGPRQALRMLLKEDYDVLMASGPAAARDCLAEEKVDLVITDIRMPDGSGIDLLRHIRSCYPDVQVILLTGFGQLTTAMEAIELGAFAYLEKPFDNLMLLKKVEGSLEKRRAERERRALEYLALQANRFETVGRLLSGTLHDLGTPLSVIGSHIELMRRESLSGTVERRLDIMESQVQHCHDLVRCTMNFLRQAPDPRAQFTLNSVVSTCLDVARPLIARQQIVVQVSLDPNLSNCEGNLVLIRQAVLNLVTNACQAMERQPWERLLTIRTWNEDGLACVCVQDTGAGVPPEHQRRIFDALFSTKAESGTGLGLAVVSHVVRQHGGFVRLETPPEGGARFVLAFPTI